MKRILSVLAIAAGSIAIAAATDQPAKAKIDPAQVPKWSAEDLEFFLHGSMSTEVVPERVLRAFIKIYPDLFPASDLAYLGLIPDPAFGWPIGFSRKAEVKHLGGQSAVGINCASCHVAQITPSAGKEPIRILGATSHFNVEAFFGAVLVSTFKTSEPASMKLFLNAYFANPALDAAWEAQQAQITEKMAADPFGGKDVAPGELNQIGPGELELARDAARLPELVHSMLKLFHNMRAALHVPDQPPDKVPPASGPGRNDAFGLLSAALLNRPQPYAPIKFGLVWNVDQRTWVHWDGNTKSPLARNLLASLGLGAPLHGKRGDLDFATVKRQTDLSESIRPPKYPFAIDRAAAKRGGAHFESKCASCHGGPESDKRLYSIAKSGLIPIARNCSRRNRRKASINFSPSWKRSVTSRRKNSEFAAPGNISQRRWAECGRVRPFCITAPSAPCRICSLRRRNARKLSIAAPRNTMRTRWGTPMAAVTSSIRLAKEIPIPATTTGRNCRPNRSGS